MTDTTVKGILLALTAAICWGVSGCMVQFLFEQRGVSLSWIISCRLLAAGLLLLVIAAFSSPAQVLKPWANKKDAFSLTIFSVLGMSAVQYTYFAAIRYSNAATATIIQYLGPVFIVLYLALKNRRWPRRIEYTALLFACGGTFLLATHGKVSQLSISPQALLFGVLSAIALAFYTLQPLELLSKYKPVVVVGWGLLIGGVLFSILKAPWHTAGIIWDLKTYLYIIFMIVFGTLVPFYAYLYAVTLIGGQKASLLASAEPLSATVLTVFWLGVSFTALDWIGSLLIISTIFVLTYASKKEGKQQRYSAGKNPA